MSDAHWARAYALYGAAGFQFAVLIGGLAYAGNWADERWGTTPWLGLTGILVGSVAGFVNLWRIVQLAAPKDEE